MPAAGEDLQKNKTALAAAPIGNGEAAQRG
jgi:hypothetical protein